MININILPVVKSSRLVQAKPGQIIKSPGTKESYYLVTDAVNEKGERYILRLYKGTKLGAGFYCRLNFECEIYNVVGDINFDIIPAE